MNCIIVDDDDASRKIIAQLAKQVAHLNIVKECKNPLEAIAVLKNENVDLIFLDIEMPQMSGIDMLRSLDNRPAVILTTTHKEYAIDAFELNVVDYIVKPVALPRFLKAVGKVKESTDIKELTTSTEYFFIKKDSVLTKVPVKEILWIEALGDYITIHTRD